MCQMWVEDCLVGSNSGALCPNVQLGNQEKILDKLSLKRYLYSVDVHLVDAPPMWTSTCCGHCFHGPSIVQTVQNVSTTVDSSPLWTLFAWPSSVHIRGPSLYYQCYKFILNESNTLTQCIPFVTSSVFTCLSIHETSSRSCLFPGIIIFD